MTDTEQKLTDFKFSKSGPIHALEVHLRLDSDDDYPVGRRLACSIVLLWLPLLVLSAIEGTLSGSNVDLPFLRDWGPHVRFLVALPLLAITGAVIDPIIAKVLGYLKDSGIVPVAQQTAFDSLIANLRKHASSRGIDVVLISIAIALSWYFKVGYGDGTFGPDNTSWLVFPKDGAAHTTWAGYWYLHVGALIFMLAMARWLWRFVVWSHALYRISKLDLDLVPAHPDQAGGLGLLAVGQTCFAIVFVAFGAVLSSTLAYDVLYKGDNVAKAAPIAMSFVLLSAIVLFAPLLFFVKQMSRTRMKGLLSYGSLGYGQVAAFDRKWTRQAPETKGEDLLNSADPSATTDYAGTYETVRSMQVVPITFRNVTSLVGILLLPFLPLLLLQFSLMDLLRKLVGSLV